VAFFLDDSIAGRTANGSQQVEPIEDGGQSLAGGGKFVGGGGEADAGDFRAKTRPQAA
jgi:hypothetical protein